RDEETGGAPNPLTSPPYGGQTISKVVKQAAKTAGIPADQLGTHAGRRSVVTTLFVDGAESLEDIARFVGHAKPSTTAGYVRRLGRCPEAVARRAATILDGTRPTTRARPSGFGITPAILGATLGARPRTEWITGERR
ncbi:MAG TPA: hypothetical protein VFI47_19530, partial [Acidimicrobiales bacterium]|nr:hypothetical protein [Acidimicrobiales bacterium]